jgi:Peptidase family M23
MASLIAARSALWEIRSVARALVPWTWARRTLYAAVLAVIGAELIGASFMPIYSANAGWLAFAQRLLALAIVTFTFELGAMLAAVSSQLSQPERYQLLRLAPSAVRSAALVPAAPAAAASLLLGLLFLGPIAVLAMRRAPQAGIILALCFVLTSLWAMLAVAFLTARFAHWFGRARAQQSLRLLGFACTAAGAFALDRALHWQAGESWLAIALAGTAAGVPVLAPRALAALNVALTLAEPPRIFAEPRWGRPSWLITLWRHERAALLVPAGCLLLSVLLAIPDGLTVASVCALISVAGPLGRLDAWDRAVPELSALAPRRLELRLGQLAGAGLPLVVFATLLLAATRYDHPQLVVAATALMLTAAVTHLVRLRHVRGALHGVLFIAAAGLPWVCGQHASAFENYQTRAALRLPFDGAWSVFWGGRAQWQNYHVIARDQRFAYDFVVRVNGQTARNAGERNDEYYCYGRPILAPAEGRVVVASDRVQDNQPGRTNVQAPLGNYVILQLGASEYALLAHLRRGSVRVRAGESVRAGQPIGECGNSGNSSEPHLHFHLQTTPVPFAGDGLPAQFEAYRADGQRIGRGEPVRDQTIEDASE